MEAEVLEAQHEREGQRASAPPGDEVEQVQQE